MSALTRVSSRSTAALQNSQAADGFLKPHAQSIEYELRKLGVDNYDLLLPETRLLPFVINPQEEIKGIVYGRYKMNNGAFVGRGALVATDKRLLLVDKKPLSVKCDEVAYEALHGLNYSQVGLAGTVVLHARLGDISVRTFNHKCARCLVNAIEAQIFGGKSSEAIQE